MPGRESGLCSGSRETGRCMGPGVLWRGMGPSWYGLEDERTGDRDHEDWPASSP